MTAAPSPERGEAGPGPSGLPRAIADREFNLLRDLVYQEAGIFLSAAKRPLLVARLSRRLRDLRLDSFGAYYRRVADGNDPAELVQMLDCITTNETHFFREPRQFEFLEERVFPLWRSLGDRGLRSRRIRVWSAGCSSGEEPYSLAMTLLTHFPRAEGWSSEVLATDVSTRVLGQARAGEWPLKKAEEIPPALLKAFMLRGTGGNVGRMKAGPEIRSLVSFERLNLNDAHCPVDGAFDLVFCRNVLIYFDAASRRGVVDRLLRRLGPEGLLLLGHAESLTGVTSEMQCVTPNVYAWPGPFAASLGARPRSPRPALGTARREVVD